MQKYCHYSALLSFLGLFVLLMAWHTVLMPPTRLPIALVLIITVTPLLLPLKGFLHGKPKSNAWMAYISLIYIVHGIVEGYANPAERYLAAAEGIL